MQTCVLQCQVGVNVQLALCLLLLTTLQLCHLPPLLSPPSVTLLVCSFDASPCMPAVVLFRVLKIENVFFIFCVCLLFTCYFCEKYYKLITV